MDVHHLLEAAGILAFGVLFYSSSYGWYRGGGRRERLARLALNGLVFGGLAVTLMVARIQVDDGVFIDPRAVPIALVGLFEGWPSALAAAAVAMAYRGWLRGSGMWAGIASTLASAVAAGLVHAWARREGGVRPRHAFALGGAVFAAAFLGFLMLGRRGLALFGATWPYRLVAYVVGVGLLARFFHDTVERARLDDAQRRFRALIDDASDAIRIVDRGTGRVVEAN
ncbi:MAG TPA: LytS/YhcK type 5TM receptor domain-containing protein, partial [Methylomirabilota bacterium]|nr:LytS/YhcK type 5TM receptor domain-containing protein [Methylomirabilota bacterium]